MARDGLSERECAEILGELRRQCCSVNDELLVWLASTFTLKAPVDFDPNDLALLLNQPERKVIRQKTFSQDITPTDALEALLSEVGAEDGCSGGLLILRSTAKRIYEYWTCLAQSWDDSMSPSVRTRMRSTAFWSMNSLMCHSSYSY